MSLCEDHAEKMADEIQSKLPGLHNMIKNTFTQPLTALVCLFMWIEFMEKHEPGTVAAARTIAKEVGLSKFKKEAEMN